MMMVMMLMMMVMMMTFVCNCSNFGDDDVGDEGSNDFRLFFENKEEDG